jgi:hypothetical protein
LRQARLQFLFFLFSVFPGYLSANFACLVFLEVTAEVFGLSGGGLLKP